MGVNDEDIKTTREMCRLLPLNYIDTIIPVTKELIMFYEKEIDLSTLKPSLMARLRTFILRVKRFLRNMIKLSEFNLPEVPDVLSPVVNY